MQDLDEANAQELIAAWEQSAQKRNAARRSITLLILGVVAVFGTTLGAFVAHFRHNRVGDFRKALSGEVGRLTPRAGAELGAMSQRLYPVYVASFQRTFAQQGPVMQQKGLEEMKKLDAHAQDCWPKIEAGVADVVSNSEATVRVEMSRFVTTNEAETISAAYGEALQKRLDSLLATTLKEHAAVAGQIGTNLTKIVALEPDIRPPVNMQATLGILLELTGLELQGVQ